ncbi:MAG TPA: PIN domain-containing protein [Steroidobacteraceae bacterium]|nr:PIN domain-containing protein [Steroidobacteraceae bacterium]
MTALVFVDTNVLVYARDPRDPVKQSGAREWISLLWDGYRGRTSAQVLSEFYDVATRKLRPQVPHDDAWEEVHSYLSWNPQPTDTDVLTRAREIERRYGLSWWNCLVVGAAQAQDCALLLSDDLQDGADYAGVRVRSPFTLRIAEEAGAYPAAPRVASRHRGRGRPRGKARATELQRS